MPSRPERIGLTGASGVLGRHLAQHFSASGAEVRPFSGDVSDEATVRGFVRGLDVVVHAAAIVPVVQVDKSVKRTIEVNVGGTALVAQAAADDGAHFVYVSSSHVYRPAATPLKETSELGPSSRYGLSKLQGEEWATSYSPHCSIVRCFSFFDAAQPESYLSGALRKRISAAKRGDVLPLPGASSVRDFSDASHVAALVAAVTRFRPSGAVNCGTGTGTSVLRFARLMAKALNRADVDFATAGGAAADHVVADVALLRQMWPDLPKLELETALHRAFSPHD